MEKKLFGLTVVGIISLFSCSDNQGGSDPSALAVVGKTIVTREDFDAFNLALDLLPRNSDTFDITRGDRISAILHVETIFQKESWNIANLRVFLGKSWKWKRRNLISQIFAADILQRNCGYSDKEVFDYFIAHKNNYGAPADTELSHAWSSDSIFRSVRWDVAKDLFLSNYKPDSADWDLGNPRAFQIFRESTYLDYFLKKYFKQKYGKNYHDSLPLFLARDKIGDSTDILAVLSWLSWEQRNFFKENTPALANRMLRWRLFCEQADRMGFSSLPRIKQTVAWAWKIEIGRRYVRDRLAPIARRAVPFDSSMAFLSYLDEHEGEVNKVDSNALEKYYAQLTSLHAGQRFDSLVFALRRSIGVRFLQPGSWADGWEQDPARLLRRADSARDSGERAQAAVFYNVLTDYYGFSDEGLKAHIELAKIQADSGEPQAAIANYRRFLIGRVAARAGLKDSLVFQIGFLYDRQLNKKELAVMNYRWVMKNAPRGKLAGDAKIPVSLIY